ncbi:serine/threonine protein kinase [Purpureocillium lilacinum]|uniref:EKC/KEOPS complex subunit BUD32 n=1 Tax=Purpureocillium lilacinum TaxID=33203 RepID=A0ABR0BJF9_PURLI|nr:hypothetical protein Purlil1_11486 [Purpureocillium lilacinum]GJN86996.1 serine/threonine protein kinase [Purpureocillium lilacinum]
MLGYLLLLTVVAELVFGDKYRIEDIRELGIGTSSTVFLGSDIVTKTDVAIKLGDFNSEHEAGIYKLLVGREGIPEAHWFGSEGGNNVMVLDLLGSSLKDVLKHRGRKFSLKTVLLLADDLIDLLAYIHGKSVIHGDVRPHNILIGTGKRATTVNVIDFDMAEKYCDPKDSNTPCYGGMGPTETAHFASENSRLREGKSRRDDLESLGYVLIYFLRYRPLYRNLESDAAYGPIKKKMAATPIKDLCTGLPPEFATYLDYTRSLGHEEKPDYSKLRNLFSDLFRRKSFQRDGVFDWVTEKNGSPAEEVVTPPHRGC